MGVGERGLLGCRRAAGCNAAGFCRDIAHERDFGPRVAPQTIPGTSVSAMGTLQFGRATPGLPAFTPVNPP